MYTINDVSQTTGFNLAILRKYIKRLKPILDPYTQRGDCNRLLFDNNGMAIFDRIKQFRAEGLTLPDIEKKLKQGLEQTDKTASKNDVKTPDQTSQTPDLLKNLLDLHHQLSQEKEKRIHDRDTVSEQIRELEKTNQELKTTLKLLPEGKSPEEIKTAWEENQKNKQEAAKIMGQLKTLGSFSFRKRKKLLTRLEELLG